jgi:hypothetical protein
MPQNFVRPASAALTASIEGASSAEEIRELCKSTLVADRVIERERGNGYGDVLTREAETALPGNSSSASTMPQYKFEREVQFAESTGRRSMLIHANTIEDLDALENLVRR